jgi:tRNA modification GTPase
LAALEAAIDFPDEDLPHSLASRAGPPLRRLLGEISAAAEDLRGERVRQGYRVALIGAPNAGKSSLLNRLVGREAAIVTEIAGTTRDVIEQPMELAGYRLLLADTAGLQQTDDRIEAEGVRRARAWAEAADLRLWVVDASASDGVWRAAAAVARQGDVVVFNKTDLPQGRDAGAVRDAADALELEPVESAACKVDGVVALRSALERRVVRDLGRGEPPAATRLRHRRLLAEAAGHLGRSLGADGRDPELMAEDVRLAARALAALTGRVDSEAVLEAVFSTFCIGKRPSCIGKRPNACAAVFHAKATFHVKQVASAAVIS